MGKLRHCRYPGVLAIILLLSRNHALLGTPAAKSEQVGVAESSLPAPGQTLEATLPPGETREYDFEISAGKFVQITLDRRGPGIGAKLVDDSGRTIREMPAKLSQYGPEPFSLASQKPARYRLLVKVDQANGAASRYLLSVSVRRVVGLDRFRLMAEIAHRQGEVAADRGSSRENRIAVRRYAQALRLYRKVDDSASQAAALESLSSLDHWQGDYEKAIHGYERALPLARSAGNRFREAHLLADIGFAYDWWRKTDRALEYCNKALPLLKELGDTQGVAGALDTIGDAYRQRGEYDLAFAQLLQALQASRAAGDRRMETYNTGNLGAIFEVRGDLAGAKDCYLIARSLQQVTSNVTYESQALQNLPTCTNKPAKLSSRSPCSHNHGLLAKTNRTPYQRATCCIGWQSHTTT
jgi:tetratricopeptide (TPR) repeat protein